MAFDTSNVADLKAQQRTLARRRRRELNLDPAQAAKHAADNFMHSIGRDRITAVAGYATHRSELDVWPLLHLLSEEGTTCCLPVLAGPVQALEFRQWHPNTALKLNHMGISEPEDSADLLQPDIVVTPLLAFDRKGYRLGYGGGYYDRTLRRLRAQDKVIAVGFAYRFQEVDEVPIVDTDEPLDWVVTDSEVIRIGR